MCNGQDMKDMQIVNCYGGVFSEARRSYKVGQEQFAIKWMQLAPKNESHPPTAVPYYTRLPPERM